MPTVVVCKRDPVSMLAGRHLTEKYFEPTEKEFSGYAVHRYRDADLIIIDTKHIYMENLHQKYPSDMYVFLSLHSSEKGVPTITVHPIGNYGDALYGGLPGVLVDAPVYNMYSALEYLSRNAPKGYSVSYEVTHHGPYTKNPAFFIEVGSTEREWNDEEAARSIAEAAVASITQSKKVVPALGVGGGHYAPRFTEIALKKRVGFGHMVPRYVKVTEDVLEKMYSHTVPRPERIAIHGEYEVAEKWAQEKGIKIVD